VSKVDAAFSRIESAVAVHLKGWQSVLWDATKWSMRCTSCLTLVNEARRMALSVISAKKRSTWLSQELWVAMTCMCQRGRCASHALIVGGLWVA
jgi:hypothetical protein